MTSKQLREWQKDFDEHIEKMKLYGYEDCPVCGHNPKRIKEHVQSLLDSVREEYKGRIMKLKLKNKDFMNCTEYKTGSAKFHACRFYNEKLYEFNSKVDELLKKL